MSTARAPELLPLFLKIAGRAAVVVGAGEVAARKIEALLESGALVRVVAPRATAAVEALARDGRVTWEARPFEASDLDGAWLVFAATDDPVAQASVSDAAGARRVFCVAVDDPPNASAYSGAIVRRPPFTLAISSGGAAPALTRLVRELVEQVLPGPDWVEEAQRLRARWRADATPMADRFGELVTAFQARAKQAP